VSRTESFRDHYDHYRRHVALGRIHAAVRALYHEATGRDWRWGR
jgi:hypothetical protein